MLCGHQLGKGWPLSARLWCLTVSLSLSHWYPGSGVVLDCIDSLSLHPYLPRKFMVVNILYGIEKVSVLRQGRSILKDTLSASSYHALVLIPDSTDLRPLLLSRLHSHH